MSLPIPLRWCGVERPHVAHNFAQPETSIGVTACCPGSAGLSTTTNTPTEPRYPHEATVCVRLDGLADKIAATILDTPISPTVTFDRRAAVAVVALLSSQ